MGLKGDFSFGVFLLMMLIVSVKGQETPQCVNQLIPCQNYLNATKPPSSCCDPLRTAVETELSCLCNLFQNKELMNAFKINVTQALELPKRCNISSDLSACSTLSPTGSALPPASKGGNDDNGASRMALIGMTGLVGLLFFWVSILV